MSGKTPIYYVKRSKTLEIKPWFFGGQLFFFKLTVLITAPTLLSALKMTIYHLEIIISR